MTNNPSQDLAEQLAFYNEMRRRNISQMRSFALEILSLANALAAENAALKSTVSRLNLAVTMLATDEDGTPRMSVMEKKGE